MSNLQLEKPSRQSPVGIAVIFFKNLRIAVNILLSVIAVRVGFDSFLGLSLYHLGIGIIVIFFIISYLQYRRFFFYVENDHFVIEKGLLSKEKITVPFERIQTVNTKQNIIQQILNVVALTIDTAGSSGKELEISALPKSYARELQQYLVRQKELRTSSSEGEEDKTDSEESRSEQWQSDTRDERPLIKLGIGDLLKVGLTENHLRTGLLVFAVVNGYVWQYQEYLLEPYQPYLERQANELIGQYMIIIPTIIFLFLLLSVVLSLGRTILKYFDLRFFVSSRGVHMVSGLLKRMEYQIPVNKIQYLKWKSNPLRKIIGLKTLIVKQASSQETADRQSISVPGCSQDQLMVVLGEFYPERRVGRFFSIRPASLLGLQLGTWLGLIPALGLCFLTFLDWRLVGVPVLYLPVALFFIWKYVQTVEFSMNREMLFLTKGWVFPSTLALKFYKLQNVTLSQSIFQKRRGLASITFYTAAGDETVPHIPLKEVQEIYNYVLYKVQVDERGWM